VIFYIAVPHNRLFGYTDNSNKGSYQYERKGILADVPHFKLLRGAIIVRSKDQRKIISVLEKHKVKYLVFNIAIKRSMLH